MKFHSEINLEVMLTNIVESQRQTASSLAQFSWEYVMKLY